MMASSPKLIDMRAHRRHRDRAAARFRRHDFIKQTAATRLAERLEVIRRRFPLVLDLGAHQGETATRILETGKADKVILADPSPAMLAQAPAGLAAVAMDYGEPCFAPSAFDAIISGFSLHWADDLPGLLRCLRLLLKPDGLLLISLAGGDSLSALRACLIEAETETMGGLSPRVLPMADIRDLGALLSHAGFAMPVADSEAVHVSWRDLSAMMADLRGMGETNALAGRIRHMTRRETLARAGAIYKQRFAAEDGRIHADIELITLTAWAPGADQPQPLKRGSAQVNLADFLDANPKL